MPQAVVSVGIVVLSWCVTRTYVLQSVVAGYIIWAIMGSIKKVCSRAGCYRSTSDKDGRCPLHKKKYNWRDDKERGSSAARGYGRQWRRVRDERMAADKGLCQPCLRKGKYTAAAEVDHVVPKSQGGTDEIGNLQSICTACHRTKTQTESMVVRN